MFLKTHNFKKWIRKSFDSPGFDTDWPGLNTGWVGLDTDGWFWPALENERDGIGGGGDTEIWLTFKLHWYTKTKTAVMFEFNTASVVYSIFQFSAIKNLFCKDHRQRDFRSNIIFRSVLCVERSFRFPIDDMKLLQLQPEYPSLAWKINKNEWWRWWWDELWLDCVFQVES